MRLAAVIQRYGYPGKLLVAWPASSKKLSELEDAQNSLPCCRTSVLCTDETREPLGQQANAKQ